MKNNVYYVIIIRKGRKVVAGHSTSYNKALDRAVAFEKAIIIFNNERVY